MSEFPWYRFYNETLTDRKIMRICRDSGQPKAVVIGAWSIILALASQSPDRGRLLISDDVPFTPDEVQEETGLDEDVFNTLIARFMAYGLLEEVDGCWEICNWHKRQPNSDSSTERVRRHRQNKAVTKAQHTESSETLPKRFSNVIDIDTDTETETEGGTRARATPLRPAKASPPPLVKSQSSDKTPEGFKATQGYKPPAEPPPGNRREPSAEVVAVGELANAITEVTGVSAKLNWSDRKGDGVGDLAEALHQAGYTAEQVRAHYGRKKLAERWNWYESDWRGKKGDRPRLKEIRETIAGAVVDQPGKPQQESGQSWLEQSLRLARANGLLPQT